MRLHSKMKSFREALCCKSSRHASKISKPLTIAVYPGFYSLTVKWAQKNPLKSEEWPGCVIQITENLQLSTENVASNQPVMKQRSPVVNQRLVHHVSLRRNSDVSPSPLNTLWHQQMSSRSLLCSWFDRERSSAQEEKWRHDSLQLETSIWKHTHTYINTFDLIHWL